MSDAAKDFITKFHSLPGESVKSKQNALFQLFLQNASLKNNETDLNYITSNLKPLNHLERIFQVDFFIHFRRFDDLLGDFKKGDDVTISKLSKHDWFFQNMKNEMFGEDFVTKVLPSLSFSVKVKVLKLLPIGETEADAIFDQLYQRYGLHFSTVFLPKCSKSKIRDVLKTEPVKFTHAQLKKIYDKDPDLIPTYIEKRSEHLGGLKFLSKNPFLVFIAQKNPKMFADLYDKYEFEASLGRRTTKTFIANAKTAVLPKLEAYLTILNKSSAVRRLGQEVKHVLFKPHPTYGESMWEHVLWHYPKNKQFEIYETKHNEVFRHKFGENIDQVSWKVLERMPDAQEREKLAKLIYKKTGKREVLKYATPEYCLGELTSKMNHMSSDDRASYVELVTDSCILNKDLNTLLKVSEMMVTRFKNDDKSIKHRFVYALFQKKIVDDFTEQHWKHIMDLMAIMDTLDESHFRQPFLHVKYIKFMLKNNKDLKEHIMRFPGWVKDYIHFSNIFEDPLTFVPYLKVVLELGLTKPDPNDDNAAADYDSILAYGCHNLNTKKRKNFINVLDYPRMLQSAKKLLEIGHENHGYHIEGMEFLVYQTDTPLELKKLFINDFKSAGSVRLCQWFLKHDPQTFCDCYDKVLENFIHVYRFYTKTFARLIKKHTHLKLDTRTVEFCTTKLGQDCQHHHLKRLATALAILAPHDVYLGEVNSRLPTSNRVDLDSEETKQTFKIQTLLAERLHWLNSPMAVLPTVTQFCVGDYLQHGLAPFYSSMYKLPMIDAKPWLRKIQSDKAVSVKKHYIHLSCVLNDSCGAVDSLTNTQKTEALLPTLKYFAKNPNDSLWNLLETQITALDGDDLLLLKRGIRVKIPVAYRNQYFGTLWKILDKYDDKEIKRLVLTEMENDCLQSEIAYQIIQSSIFKLCAANGFIANFFIHSDATDRFNFLTSVLNDFKSNHWDRKESRVNLSKLVSTLFVKYMYEKEPNREFVSHILTSFKSVFPLHEAFREIVFISCMALKKQPVDVCGKLLIQLNKECCFDNHVFGLFADIIDASVLKCVFKTDNERIQLCYSTFKNKQTVNDSLLIIRLLPRCEVNVAELYIQYDEILTYLRHVDSDIVRCYYNLYRTLAPGSSWNKLCVI